MALQRSQAKYIVYFSYLKRHLSTILLMSEKSTQNCKLLHVYRKDISLGGTIFKAPGKYKDFLYLPGAGNN